MNTQNSIQQLKYMSITIVIVSVLMIVVKSFELI